MKGLLVWLVLLLLCLSGARWARNVGTRLPLEHRASASGMVAAPPERVWELVTETLPQDEWRKGVRRVQTQDPLWTQGVCWTEYWALLRFPLCVAEEQPRGRRVVKTQDWGPMPFAATWTYELAPVDGGTRVTITEESSIRAPLWAVLRPVLAAWTNRSRAGAEGFAGGRTAEALRCGGIAVCERERVGGWRRLLFC